MNPLLKTAPQPDNILCKTLLNAQDELGLTQAELGATIGLNRSSISRLKTRGCLNPASKEGELALCVIRIYRALYALVGGNHDNLQHWLRGGKTPSGSTGQSHTAGAGSGSGAGIPGCDPRQGMSELWESSQGIRHIRPLVLSATRVVESQEQVATLALVDSIEEQ